MNKLYVDFHVIQTVPPSCVNRDDTGSPKTAMFGGARRARISSQSWKHEMRIMFREYFDEGLLGIRTKKIVELVAQKLSDRAPEKPEEEIKALAEKVINAAGVTTKDGEAKALFFMSTRQAECLAEMALNDTMDKKTVQNALNQGNGIDIALFGRMVADAANLNVDASAQVAHAISTHRVENEFDYFTAVDDLQSADNAGAAMIDTVEFNSSTLYRYATVAAHELYRSLADDAGITGKAIAEFCRAFATSMPKGKQNPFANKTLPDAMLVAIRKDQPINLVGAFEEPIKSREGYVKMSVERFVQYSKTAYDSFANEPSKAYVIGTGFNEFGAPLKLDQLLAELEHDVVAAIDVL